MEAIGSMSARCANNQLLARKGFILAQGYVDILTAGVVIKPLILPQ